MVLTKLLGHKEVLQIEGMTCGHCSSKVEKALVAIKGVKKAIVCHEKNNAIVRYDPDIINKQVIVDAIKKAGYTPL